MIKRLGLEYCLPLLAVAAFFWLATHWLDRRVLGSTNDSIDRLVAQPPHTVELSFSLTIMSIDAEIEPDSGLTEVNIRTTGSVLKEVEFEYPLIEYDEIEAALAKELDLDPAIVRQMIRYRIYD